MTRAFWLSILALASVLVLMVGPIALGEAAPPAELIARADDALQTRHLLESMTEAIALYEAVLPNLDSLPVQTQAYVLNRLSQLCYEVALFTEGETREDGQRYTQGKEYGFQSMRLNPAFAAAEADGLEQALVHVTDLAAMHWTANNWGMLCGMNPLQGLLQQGSVLVLFQRCVDLEPGFWGGSSASALGSLLIMLPGPMGGDVERGLALVEGSLISDASYLQNRIILAEYWGFTYNMFGAVTGVRDADLIRRETALILEAEIGDWPFWNRQAKLSAERLLAQLGEYED